MLPLDEDVGQVLFFLDDEFDVDVFRFTLDVERQVGFRVIDYPSGACIEAACLTLEHEQVFPPIWEDCFFDDEYCEQTPLEVSGPLGFLAGEYSLYLSRPIEGGGGPYWLMVDLADPAQ